MTIGRLYGLGLGPGDPELVTLKAVRLLRSVPVVAYGAPMAGDSFARGIAAQWLDRGQCEIAIRFPMRPGAVPVAIYQDAAAQLAAILDRGDDIAYLCQGDPFFYGSFIGIFERLASRYDVAVIPGVSSMTTCSAAAGLPLVRRDGALAVIPATLPEDELERRLAAGDAAVVIKLGRHFGKLCRVLARLGRLKHAVYVERASLLNERIAPLATIDAGSVPYFATALVPPRDASA